MLEVHVDLSFSQAIFNLFWARGISVGPKIVQCFLWEHRGPTSFHIKLDGLGRYLPLSFAEEATQSQCELRLNHFTSSWWGWGGLYHLLFCCASHTISQSESKTRGWGGGSFLRVICTWARVLARIRLEGHGGLTQCNSLGKEKWEVYFSNVEDMDWGWWELFSWHMATCP